MDRYLSLEASAYDLPEITVRGVVHVQICSAYCMFYVCSSPHDVTWRIGVLLVLT